MTRRAAAGAAASLMLALVLASQTWAELPRRVRFLAAFAPKELAVRRLGGSGAAFDRKFFSFLENARRRMPLDTAAVVLVPEPSETHRYLATYYLAPLPVYVGPFPDRSVPKGWLIACYGEPPTTDLRVLARLPEGALFAPSQR